jgi:hypothetical protein
MKTKLVLLVCLGTLAVGASVPNAMAKVKVPPSARKSEVTRKGATALGKVPKQAAVPSHTILSRAKI